MWFNKLTRNLNILNRSKDFKCRTCDIQIIFEFKPQRLKNFIHRLSSIYYAPFFMFQIFIVPSELHDMRQFALYHSTFHTDFYRKEILHVRCDVHLKFQKSEFVKLS